MRLIRFGVFEADIQTGELSKQGRRIHVQEQPFRILVTLLERPGQVVTREELRHVLWPDDVNVDFDHGLNVAVKKIRDVFDDSATSPRYIETLPRHGYRFIAPVEVVDSESGPPPRQGLQRRVSHLRGAAVVAILVLVASMAVWLWIKESRARWARNEALPEIERLIENDRYYDAFCLARRAAPHIPDDFYLQRLLKDLSVNASIQTVPEGAEVHIKDYLTPDAEWDRLGVSPLEDVLIPIIYFRFRATKEGFEPVEGALMGVFHSTIEIPLHPSDSSPPDMVHVPGGPYTFGTGSPVVLKDYWIDRHEVTNRQFQKFVTQKGYQREEYWKHSFVRDGEVISWDDAMDVFRDRAGRPGPSTWEDGTYPEGAAELPVSGVSWYEAAAYAEFAGKRLPTVHHWAKAAGIGERGQGTMVDLRPLSNFSGQGLSEVGSYQGLSPYGTYDMAGNVKEWCWNHADDRHYILGGAWSEPMYMFQARDAARPFNRSAVHGFRCMKPTEPLPGVVLAPVPPETLSRDIESEQPVSDEVFDKYRSLYSYDRTDLNARIESVDDRDPDWRTEKVSFDAAYENERVIAYLFLPRNAAPPYQTVVHYPGGEASTMSSSERLTLIVDFIIRSGRAVLLPVYRGHYERRLDRSAMGRGFWRSFAARDLLVQQAKDLRRSIDYLETRPDIDIERLAYSGISAGAALGPIFTAIEDRFKASVLLAGGLPKIKKQPETDQFHFAPRARVPVLMINGRHDFVIDLETAQIPLFRLLGAPDEHKRHALFDSGHIPPRAAIIREVLVWLDRYLGPVIHSGAGSNHASS